MKKSALIMMALVFAPTAAFADTTAAVKLSTLGVGVDAAFPMTESIDARIGFNVFNFNANRNSNGTNFHGKLNLGSAAALVDWHPMASSFRVSGGLIYNNNNFSMSAVPTGGTITIGGVNYATATAGSASANVDFAKIAPYVGIGWGSAPKDSGLSFAADVGVMFQGTPRARVTATGAVAAADLAKASSDLANSLRNFRYYPVVSLGVGYTF